MSKVNFSKKLFCIILTLTMLLSAMPVWNISASSLQKGNQTFSGNSNNSGVADVKMQMYNATSVSGNTVTYVVDRYYYSDLSQLGTLYNVDFSVNGCSEVTNISTTDYSLSDSGYSSGPTNYNATNVFWSKNVSGTIYGAVPQAGQSRTFTITASNTGTYYFGGAFIQDYNASVSATVIVKAIDSTPIQNEISACNNLRSTCWTSATWSALQNAISYAQGIQNSVNATVEQVSSAAAAIKSARDNLVHNGGTMEGCQYCCYGAGTSSATQVDTYSNISYGNAGERNMYDLYLPSNVYGDCSLILFIHGGSWLYGSKESFGSDAYNSCAQFGIAAATVNYRFTTFGDVDAWAILDDIQAAVAHIKNFAATKGLNIKKMMLYGYSAGAHLSLLYGYTRKDVSPVRPVCVFDKSGPATLANPQYLDWSSGLMMPMSCLCGFWYSEETAAYAVEPLLKVSPWTYVDSNSLPTVVCHGAQDDIVPFSDSSYLVQKLSDCGVEHEFIVFPNSDHNLADDPDCLVKMNDAFTRYVSKYLLDNVPEAKHNYIAQIKAPTCTKEGYTKFICTDCGKWYLSDFIPASHTLGEWETVTPATFDSKGLEIQKCSVCKEIINSKDIEILEQPKIEVKDKSGNIHIDAQNALITGTEQGMTDISEMFNLTNCVFEYTQTSKGFGTGSAVTVKSILGDVVANYTLVIYGDVTGDGYVDAFDISNATEYINNFDEPEGIAYKKSLDIVEDGYLDATDLAYLIRCANFE